MAIENVGPGGVGNSYGARTASPEALSNSASPKNVYNEYSQGTAVIAARNPSTGEITGLYSGEDEINLGTSVGGIEDVPGLQEALDGKLGADQAISPTVLPDAGVGTDQFLVQRGAAVHTQQRSAAWQNYVSHSASGSGYQVTIGTQVNKVGIVCTWEQSLTTQLASNFPGHKAFITDVGEYGSEWISDGTDWNPLHPITLSAQTVSSVSIGQKTDVDALYGDLWTYTLPRSMLIKTRALSIEPVFVYPNSATTKNLRVTFGGASAYQKARTTSALEAPLIQIIARGSATSQITPYATPSLYASASTGTVNTSTVNCASAVVIAASAQWGTAGTGSNIISLESLRLRLIP